MWSAGYAQEWWGGKSVRDTTALNSWSARSIRWSKRVVAYRQHRKGTWGQFMLTLMTLIHLKFRSREWCQSIMGWGLTWLSSWSQKIHTVWCLNGPRDVRSPRWTQGSGSRFSWRRSNTLSMIVSSRSSSHSATATHLWCMELVSLRTNRSSLVKKWKT